MEKGNQSDNDRKELMKELPGTLCQRRETGAQKPSAWNNESNLRAVRQGSADRNGNQKNLWIFSIVKIIQLIAENWGRNLTAWDSEEGGVGWEIRRIQERKRRNRIH